MTSYQNGNRRILIVDDESSIRDLLHAILSERYTCQTADSAEAAVSQLEHNVFDLVISDINMGGMSGIDLVSHVKGSSPDTVVMMISGNQAIESPIEAIRTGAFDYVRKPFEVDHVEIAVRRALEHADLLAAKRRHEEHLEQLVAERTEKLNYLAYNDSLTGLSNRAFFEEHLAQTLSGRSRSDRIAVAFISIDKFKGLRDTLGHTHTCDLLKDAAARLEGMRSPDSVIARFDSDEFAMMLCGKGQTELAEFSERIFEAFRRPVGVGEYEIFLSISIGISLFPDDAGDAQSLLKYAGTALSHAIKQGGNVCQFYTTDLHERALRKLALEGDLRRALERDEFELYYQPKVATNTGRIVGMEALIRWNHPTLGMVSPLDFITVAEDSGLIVPIGEWILETACTQSKSWCDAGYPLHLAVNLSACQFQQGDLVETINQITQRTGFDPALLNLEVTESSIMIDTEAAVSILRELRETGISISIDDFGTGYSSLGYLKHLPIDVLKIDKSFVNDVTENQDDAALVMAIITLGHTLRLKVVAEGVETDDQLRLLHLLRCDEWQGYLFSKPLPAGQFAALVASHADARDLQS